MQGPFNHKPIARILCSAARQHALATILTIVVRPRPGQRAETLATSLVKAVAELDSNLPTYFAGTPARLHDEILGVNRITATLFALFGVVAFVLSAVGLYGVMSFSVNQRTQEFGIRIALGADAARIFRMVMTQGAWQLAIGLFSACGGAALLPGVLAAAALAKHSVQGERTRSLHLFRRRRNAYAGGRGLVLCSGATRDASQPDGCFANGVKCGRSDAAGYLLPVVCCLSEWSSDWDERLMEDAE